MKKYCQYAPHTSAAHYQYFYIDKHIDVFGWYRRCILTWKSTGSSSLWLLYSGGYASTVATTIELTTNICGMERK